MLLQPRPNQPTNATTSVAMVATAMDSLVKGILGKPPSLSRLPTHQQNPQLLHPLHLVQETHQRPSRSAEQGSPFPSCCTNFLLFVQCFFIFVTYFRSFTIFISHFYSLGLWGLRQFHRYDNHPFTSYLHASRTYFFISVQWFPHTLWYDHPCNQPDHHNSWVCTKRGSLLPHQVTPAHKARVGTLLALP